MINRGITPDPSASTPGTRSPVSLKLSDRDLWLVHSALQVYLASFSHTEGELVHEVKDLILRLQSWMRPGSSENAVTLSDAEELTL